MLCTRVRWENCLLSSHTPLTLASRIYLGGPKSLPNSRTPLYSPGVGVLGLARLACTRTAISHTILDLSDCPQESAGGNLLLIPGSHCLRCWQLCADNDDDQGGQCSPAYFRSYLPAKLTQRRRQVWSWKELKLSWPVRGSLTNVMIRTEG